MRDILLVVFLFISIYYSFKKPYLGVAAWIWIALTAPVYWAYGFSQSFRMNFTIAIVVFISSLVAKDKLNLNFTAIHFLVLFFLFWTFLASVFNLRIDNEYVWTKFVEFSKVIVLFLFITATVKRQLHINVIVWAMVLSISSYAAMEGVKFILSGGGHRIVGRAGIIADRNDLAVAINMCLPLLLYLRFVSKEKLIKAGLLVLVVLNVVAVVGTYSRGGFIGLAILGIAIWVRSNRKLLFFMIALVLLPIAYEMAPQDWKERQETVETAATEDGSFIGRLWAWKIATLIAIDNPLTGGGFKATTDHVLWDFYAPFTPEFGPVDTPPIPDTVKAKAAHNAYFQVLGGSGFVGLVLFLLILIMAYWRIAQLYRKTKSLSDDWRHQLSKYLLISFVGFGITAMNVSLAYFDLLYAMLALTIVTYQNYEESYKNKIE